MTPPAAATPDETVLTFVEKELQSSGRLDGLTAMAYLMKLQRAGVTAEQKAALRLALALYGGQVDPAASELIRGTIARG